MTLIKLMNALKMTKVCKFLRLPRKVLVEVFSVMLTAQDLSFADMAVSSKDDRPLYLTMLTFDYFIVLGVSFPLGYDYIMWLKSRQMKVSSFVMNKHCRNINNRIPVLQHLKRLDLIYNRLLGEVITLNIHTLRDLSITFNEDVDMNHFLKQISNCKKLKRLTVVACAIANDTLPVLKEATLTLTHLSWSHKATTFNLLVHLISCTNNSGTLQTLSLNKCRYCDHIKIAQACHSLTSLHLSECNLSDAGLRAYAENHSDLNEVDISWNTELTSFAITKLVTCCTSLRTLNAGYCELIDDTCIDRLGQCCPNMTSLNLALCSQIYRGIDSLTRHQIVNLDVSYTGIGDRALHAITSSCGLTTLEVLNISYCDMILTEDLDNFVRHYSSLKSIDVSGLKITDEIVSNMVVYSPRLQAINMSHCEFITDCAVFAIASGSPDLTSLTIRYNDNITDGAIDSLVMHNHSRMESLKIARCPNVSGAALLRLASLCTASLTYLDLCGLPLLDDDAIDGISYHCVRLTTLLLADCPQIGDKSIISLCGRCRRLTHLDVSRCEKISPDSLMYLSRHPLRALTKLCLTGCYQVNNDCVYNILRRCPSIENLAVGSCGRVSPYLIDSDGYSQAGPYDDPQVYEDGANDATATQANEECGPIDSAFARVGIESADEANNTTISSTRVRKRCCSSSSGKCVVS